MLKKRILAFCLCLSAAAVLTGCGDGKVQSTVSEVVSRLGDDVSETVSRVESALDDMGSGIDSGMDGNLDSDLASDGIVDDNASGASHLDESRVGDENKNDSSAASTKDRKS